MFIKMQKKVPSRKMNLGSRRNLPMAIKKISNSLDLLSQTNLRNVQLYIWIVFSGLVFVSILAQVLFPGTYSIFSNTISDQGSPQLNPLGSIFWRIGVIINGLAHIPYLLYLTRRFAQIHATKARNFKIISITAALAFSGVGIFPLDLGLIHYIMALIAFLGYYRAANLSFEIIDSLSPPIKKISAQKIDSFVVLKVFKFYFQSAGALCLASFLINKFLLQKEVSALLEWNYLGAICMWLLIWPAVIRSLNYNQKTIN